MRLPASTSPTYITKTDYSYRISLKLRKMAYNSGGANPIGVKTGPRPEDAYVPPVNEETLRSIQKNEDKKTEKGQTKREGVIGMSC